MADKNHSVNFVGGLTFLATRKGGVIYDNFNKRGCYVGKTRMEAMETVAAWFGGSGWNFIREFVRENEQYIAEGDILSMDWEWYEKEKRA